MALALTTGTAQITTGASLTPLILPTASYLVSKDAVGEAVLTNTAGSLDQPNRARFSCQTIADIFKNQTDCKPVTGQQVAGLSMLMQLTETWKVDDAGDTLAPIYYPASAHIVLKVPQDALVTSTVIMDFVRRLIGAPLRLVGDTLSTGWNNPLHGIVKF